MPIKMPGKKQEGTDNPKEGIYHPEEPENFMVLELELYTNLTLRGETYRKGTPYQFKKTDALTLLSERDCNRPVWKIYRPVKPAVEKQPHIVDATRRQMLTEEEPIHGLPERKRIEVGTEEEIMDILDHEEENVTV